MKDGQALRLCFFKSGDIYYDYRIKDRELYERREKYA